MKIHHFDGIYQERCGFSWAMLVYRRVYNIDIKKLPFLKGVTVKTLDSVQPFTLTAWAVPAGDRAKMTLTPFWSVSPGPFLLCRIASFGNALPIQTLPNRCICPKLLCYVGILECPYSGP